MHIITANKTFNYNPTNSSSVKMEISYNVSGVLQTVISYKIDNTAINCETLFDNIVDYIYTSTNKIMSFDTQSYETVRLISNDDTITFNSLKLYWSGSDSYYLPIDIGILNQRPSSNSNVTIIADPDGYITFPYWGRYRFPLNSNSKVTSKPNLTSHPSSWDDFEIKSESETDVTPQGVFNSYTRRFHFKKVGITNISFYNVIYADAFMSYISESNTSDVTIAINTSLALLLFGDSTLSTIQINATESGFDSVTYEFENLCKYNVTMIPTSYFTRVLWDYL